MGVRANDGWVNPWLSAYPGAVGTAIPAWVACFFRRSRNKHDVSCIAACLGHLAMPKACHPVTKKPSGQATRRHHGLCFVRGVCPHAPRHAKKAPAHPEVRPPPLSWVHLDLVFRESQFPRHRRNASGLGGPDATGTFPMRLSSYMAFHPIRNPQFPQLITHNSQLSLPHRLKPCLEKSQSGWLKRESQALDTVAFLENVDDPLGGIFEMALRIHPARNSQAD